MGFTVSTSEAGHKECKKYIEITSSYSRYRRYQLYIHTYTYTLLISTVHTGGTHCTYTCIHTYIHTIHTHAYIHTYTLYIHMHTYIHTHYTYTCTTTDQYKILCISSSTTAHNHGSQCWLTVNGARHGAHKLSTAVCSPLGALLTWQTGKLETGAPSERNLKEEGL